MDQTYSERSSITVRREYTRYGEAVLEGAAEHGREKGPVFGRGCNLFRILTIGLDHEREEGIPLAISKLSALALSLTAAVFNPSTGA